MGAVRTVLGDIAAAKLGRTDYHEHLFQVSPLLPGDELEDEERSGAEAALLRQSGTTAMVEATPTGLGRNPSALARISSLSNLHVIATTGAHREAHYEPGHWIFALSDTELVERFTADIVTGERERDEWDLPIALTDSGTPVRSGLLKVGIGYWNVTKFERRILNAVAQTHEATNAPVMVHLEHGSAAFEIIDTLAEEGVPPSALALAHIDRNPDPVLHAELAAAGAYLGYDGFGRSHIHPDSALIDCFITTASMGGAERLLLGGDVARRTRYLSYGGMPGLAYVNQRVLPRFAAAGQKRLAEVALVANPARWLGRFDSNGAAALQDASEDRPRPMSPDGSPGFCA